MTDLELAQSLVSDRIVWTRWRCRQLGDLVQRNELIGSQLNREQYSRLQTLWWRVSEMLAAQEEAAEKLFS